MQQSLKDCDPTIHRDPLPARGELLELLWAPIIVLCASYTK